MNILRFLLLSAGSLFTMASCSLPLGTAGLSLRKPRPASLEQGIRYEVRPAIAATAPFEPERLKSYFVMVEPVRPAPAIASSSPSAIPVSLRAPSSVRTVRTTAYTHDEADHIAYGNLSAVGKPLRFGSIRSAAADWSRYPLGTLFRISGQPGVVYQVDDYGSALVGTDTIDLYKPSRSAMNEWGVRHVDIEVIKGGCFHNSLSLIKDRTRFPHVRKMFDNLQSRLYQTGIQPVNAVRPGDLTVML
jgi:3D (Asp-Asp-Asp) domain-containing protein